MVSSCECYMFNMLYISMKYDKNCLFKELIMLNNQNCIPIHKRHLFMHKENLRILYNNITTSIANAQASGNGFCLKISGKSLTPPQNNNLKHFSYSKRNIYSIFNFTLVINCCYLPCCKNNSWYGKIINSGKLLRDFFLLLKSVWILSSGQQLGHYMTHTPCNGFSY